MKTHKKHLFSFVILLLMFFSQQSTAWGQSGGNYQGTVTDTSGETLIGVSVLIKGTTTGVVTNIDGQYNISARQGDVLVFSYVGMVTRELPLGSQLVNNVILTEEAKGLEEVVVIGYGVAKRKDGISNNKVVNRCKRLVKKFMFYLIQI